MLALWAPVMEKRDGYTLASAMLLLGIRRSHNRFLNVGDRILHKGKWFGVGTRQNTSGPALRNGIVLLKNLPLQQPDLRLIRILQRSKRSVFMKE